LQPSERNLARETPSSIQRAKNAGLIRASLVVRRLYPSIRVIAMSGAFFGNCVPPGMAADAFFEKGSDVGHLVESVDAMTRPERPTKRLSMENLFGFPMFEIIPSHPDSEPLTNSTGQTNYQLLVSQENEQLEYSSMQE
jgi:hypothetical protein